MIYITTTLLGNSGSVALLTNIIFKCQVNHSLWWMNFGRTVGWWSRTPHGEKVECLGRTGLVGVNWKSRESALARGGCRHPCKGRLKSCAESHEHVLSCSDFITRPSQGQGWPHRKAETAPWAVSGPCWVLSGVPASPHPLPIQRRGPGQDVTEMGFKSRLIWLRSQALNHYMIT